MPAFTNDQYTSSFIHEVRESLLDKYYVVVAGGDLKVFDRATGAEHLVTFPDGKSYLTSTKGFKAVSVGGTTYLVNLDTFVRRGTKKAPTPAEQAIVYVRRADYSTNYTITLNGIATTYTTPDDASATSKTSIQSSSIVANLVLKMLQNPALTTDFDIGYLGLIQDSSTITIRRLDGADFTIATSDGLSDQGLQLVKGSVQTFAFLPEKAPDGMIVEITGDPESSVDNYWVRFDSAANDGHGLWTECPQPGSPVDLDASTMPWVLRRTGATVQNLIAGALKLATFVYNIPSTYTGGFTLDTITSTSYTGVEDITMTAHGDTLSGPLGGTLDGTTRLLTVAFDVNTTTMNGGDTLTVKLLVNDGSGYVVEDSRTYAWGIFQPNETLKFTGALHTGATVEIQIDYGSGSTPADPARVGRITVHGSGATPPGITVSKQSKVTVQFGATDIYPVGATVSITANSLTFNHTVSGSDETGVSVASALATLMAASFTVVDHSDGTFDVSNTSGDPISWSISCAATLPGTVFFSPNITLTPGAFVGQTLVDDTDGSQGTITSNSAHSITVSSLSGGTSNAIHTDDTLHIAAVSDVSFVFGQGVWDERKAGDLKVCPLPSFVDRAITECFFYKNRLGLTAGENTVLSQSGTLSNFMRQTATALLADDVIDFKSSHPDSGDIEHAVEWEDALYLFSASGQQYALTGNPVLTPTTFSLDKKSSFPVSHKVRPISIGKYLYFPRIKSNFTSVMRYYLQLNGKADARDITEPIPKYITGNATILTGDSALGIFVLRTDAALDTLWVHSTRFTVEESIYQPQQETMSSWSKWTFPGASIIAASMSDGVLALIMVRSDGAFLETIDLGVLPDGTADYRDRQGFTTPVNYTSKYQFSRIFFRPKDDIADTNGRLQLRYGTLSYHDTRGFKVTVSLEGRDPKAYTFNTGSSSTTGGYFSRHYFSSAYFAHAYFEHGTTTVIVGDAEEGEFMFPILTRNTQATIEIESTGSDGCAFSGLDWEGTYTTRDRRV